MYPFTGTDMLNEFVGIFGEENVRLISEEEFQRHALRMQQDRELQECEGADQQAKQIEDQHLCPQASSEPTTPPPELIRGTAEAAAPMTLEQLRKKRLAYFEGKKNQEQWRQRLRPRTK
jgi:hypothetical protein